MHYYKFDISAWALHTAHLTPDEEACYFRLVNYYYDTETPLPQKIAPVLRKLRLTGLELIAEGILQEFFTLDGNVWRNARCDKELADYHAKAERNRAVGKLGGRPKTQTVSTPNPEETLTTNYQLQTTNYKLKEKTPATKVAPPDGVCESVWRDFVALRNGKKAKVTETAIKGIAREAAKAGISLEQALQVCCERGWTGFKSDWVANSITPSTKSAQSPNLAAARAIFGDERTLQNAEHDITPKIAR